MGIRSAVSKDRGSKDILVDSRCVVLQIFSFLISHDLLVARLVCRQWNEWALTDDTLWQRAMERELLPSPCHEHQVTISISSVERREDESDGMAALRDEFERWRSTTYERKLKPDWHALFLSNNGATSIDGDGNASQRDTTRVVPSARMLFVLRASRRARFVFTERRYFLLFRFFQMEGTSCEELLSDLDVIPRFEGHVFCYNCGMCGHRGEDCAARPLFDDMFMSTQRSPRERKAIGGWQGGPGAWLPAATHGMTMWSYRMTPSNPNSLAPLHAQDSLLAVASTDDDGGAVSDVRESSSSDTSSGISNSMATARENGVDTKNEDDGVKRRNGLVADGTVHTNNESDDAKGSSIAAAAAAATANGAATNKKKKKKKKKSKKRNNASGEATTAVATTPDSTGPERATQPENGAIAKVKAEEEQKVKPAPIAKEREREVTLVLTSRRTDALQQAIEIVARLLAAVAPPPAPARGHELLAQDNTDATITAATSRNAAERGPLSHPPFAYAPAGGHYPPSRYPPSPHHYVAFAQPPQHRPSQPQPVGLPPHHPHTPPAHTTTPNTPAAASLHSMPPPQAVAFHGHPPPPAYVPSPAAYHPPPAVPPSSSPSPPSSPTRSPVAPMPSPPASPLLPAAPRPRSPSSPSSPAPPSLSTATTTTAASTPSVAVSTPPQPAMPPLAAVTPAPAPSSPHRSTTPTLPGGALGPYPHGAAYHPVPPPSVRHYYPPNWSHYAPYLTHHHPHHPYAAPNVAAAAALGHPFATSLHSAASTSTTSSALSSSLLSTPPSPASMSHHHHASSSPTFSFSSIALSCSTSTVSASSGASRPVTFAVHAIPAGLVSPSSSPPAATPSPLHSLNMGRTSSAPLPASSSPSSPFSSSSSPSVLPPVLLSPPTSPHMGAMPRRLSSPAIAVPAASHPPPPHHPLPPPSTSASPSSPSPSHRGPRPSSPAFVAPSSPAIVAHRVAFHVPVQGAK